MDPGRKGWKGDVCIKEKQVAALKSCAVKLVQNQILKADAEWLFQPVTATNSVWGGYVFIFLNIYVYVCDRYNSKNWDLNGIWCEPLEWHKDEFIKWWWLRLLHINSRNFGWKVKWWILTSWLDWVWICNNPPLPLDEMMSKLAMRRELSAAKIKNHTKTEWRASIFYGLFKKEATPRGLVGGGLDYRVSENTTPRRVKKDISQTHSHICTQDQNKRPIKTDKTHSPQRHQFVWMR